MFEIDTSPAALSQDSIEADKTLLVKFMVVPAKSEAKSLEAGRPIFDDVEMISITTPGSRAAMVRKSRPADRHRFPAHYKAFKERTAEVEVEGTPLDEWPRMGRSMVEELKFYNIRTVEQLANIPDTTAQKFTAGMNLKREAADWLKIANKQASVAKLQRELKSRDKLIADLTSRLDELEKLVEKEPDQQES